MVTAYLCFFYFVSCPCCASATDMWYTVHRHYSDSKKCDAMNTRVSKTSFGLLDFRLTVRTDILFARNQRAFFLKQKKKNILITEISWTRN